MQIIDHTPDHIKRTEAFLTQDEQQFKITIFDHNEHSKAETTYNTIETATQEYNAIFNKEV